MYIFIYDVATALLDRWNQAGLPFDFGWDKAGDFPSGIQVHPPVPCWQGSGWWPWIWFLGSSRVTKGWEKCSWTPACLDSDFKFKYLPWVIFLLQIKFRLCWKAIANWENSWDLVQGVRLFLIKDSSTLFSIHISNLTQLVLCTITSV